MGTDLAVIDRELTARLPMFAQLLPPSVSPQRLMRTVVMSCERNPRLLQCTVQSLMNAATTAAVLGLECDGVTGQGYLVPYGNTATFIIGYKGYNTVGARAGYTITGDVVREGDPFKFEKGTSAFLHHRTEGGKGRIVAAWAVASRPGFTPIIEVMPIEDILAIKEKSPGAKKSDSPWNDLAGPGFAAMCSKTVKRRLARSMPLSVMQQASALEDQHDQGKSAWLDERGDLKTVDAEVVAHGPVLSDTSPADITERAHARSWPKHKTFRDWMQWSIEEYLPKATPDDAVEWAQHFVGPMAAVKRRAEDGHDKEIFDHMMDLYDDAMKVKP